MHISGFFYMVFLDTLPCSPCIEFPPAARPHQSQLPWGHPGRAETEIWAEGEGLRCRNTHPGLLVRATDEEEGSEELATSLSFCPQVSRTFQANRPHRGSRVPSDDQDPVLPQFCIRLWQRPGPRSFTVIPQPARAPTAETQAHALPLRGESV